MDRRLVPLVVVLAMFALLAVVGQKLRQTGNFASVSLETNDGLAITFLRHGLRDRSACEQAGASLAGLMLANCPVCKVTSTQCLGTLSDEQRALFTEAPSNRPTARLPNGVVTYFSADPRQALAACELSEKQAGRDRVICSAPGEARPLPSALRKSVHETTSILTGLSQGLAGAILLLSSLLLFKYLRRKRAAVDAGATCSPENDRIGKVALIAVDALVLLGAFVLIAWPQTIEVGGINAIQRNILLAHGCLVAITVALFWVLVGHYSRRRPFWDELREVVKVLGTMFFVSGTVFLIVGLEAAVVPYVLVWSLSFILLPVGREAVRGLLDTLGLWKIPVLIVGSGQNAYAALEALRSETSMGYAVLALVDVKGPPLVDVRVEVATTEIIEASSIKDLDRIIAGYANPRLVIALDSLANPQSQSVVHHLSATRQNLHIIPAIRGLPLFGTELSHFFSHEVLFLTVRNNLARRSSRLIKRAVDVLGALTLLALLSPLFAWIGWKIWREDGGSIIFTQNRVGKNGEAFRFFKFRSMVRDADNALAKWQHENPQLLAQYLQSNFKLKDDPRVTKVGKFIRSYSLDELPQLWNILIGEMSLIGPRPLLERELPYYGEECYSMYKLATPGLTGLWQISGRSQTTFADRAALDSWYVQNWSIWYDVAILFRTVRVVLDREGAY